MRPKPDFLPRMRGATGSVAGRRGLVPKPAAADNVKYLKGDGSWSALSNASAATDAEAAAGASTTTFLTPAGATLSAGHAGRSSRPGIISTGASAVGTTQDNTGLAFGTGNLSIGMWVRLPDWTPASIQWLAWKSVGNVGFRFYLTTGGILVFGIGSGSGFTDYASTVATGIADGSWAFISLSIDRAGNLTFYVNGAQLGTAVLISAQSAQTLTNTNALMWLSTGSTHATGTLGETFIISGLLTATNIADIYKAGSIAPFAASFTFFQWCDFGQGYGPIIKDRSGQNQPALMGTSGLSHAVPRNPPGVPQRAPRVAIVSDGSNGSFIRATLGTQNPGAGGFLVWCDITTPVADTAYRPLWALTSNTTTVEQISSLVVYWRASSGLQIVFYGNPASETRILSNTGLVTLLAAQRWTLGVRRSATGLKVYIAKDGDLIDVTALFTESASASPPAWTDAVNGTHLVGAYYGATSSLAASIFDLRLANVAMTEAQLRTEYERGEPGAEWESGSSVATYTSDFSATVDGWAVGTGAGSVSGNVDAVGAENDWLQLTQSATSAAMIYRATFALGKHQRVTGKIRHDAAAVTSFSIAEYGNAANYVDVAVAANTTVTFDVTLPLPVSVSTLYLTVAAVQNMTTGEHFWLKAVTAYRIGYTSRLRTDTAAGLTALDGSTNKNDFLLSTTGVTVSPDGRTQTIRATTNTNGNQQLFGASVIDTTKRWRIRSWNINSSGTPTVSLGNVSAGAQYLSGSALTATNNEVTLLTRIPGTANLWCNANSTAL